MAASWSLLGKRPTRTPSLFGDAAPRYSLMKPEEMRLDGPTSFPVGVNPTPEMLAELIRQNVGRPGTVGEVLSTLGKGQAPQGVDPAGALRAAEATDQFFAARKAQEQARQTTPPLAQQPESLASVRAQYEGTAQPPAPPRFNLPTPMAASAPQAPILTQGLQLAPIQPPVAMAPPPEAQRAPATPEWQPKPGPTFADNPNFAEAAQKNSGKSASQAVTQGRTQTNQITEYQLADQAKMAALREVLMSTPEYKAMSEGNSRMEEILAAQAQRPPQLDVSAVLSLADHLTGGKMAANYKAPSEQDLLNRKMLLDYQSKLQDDKRDVFKSLQDSFTKLKTGTTTDSDIFKLLVADKLQAEDPAAAARSAAQTDQEIRWGDRIQQHLKTDKRVQKPLESLSAVQEAKTLINQGISVADNAFRTKFARAMGDAPISNVDIMRASGDSSVGHRVWQTINTALEGQYDPKNRAQYKKTLEVLEKVHKNKLAAAREYWVKQGTSTYKLDPARARAIVTDGLEAETGFFIPDPTEKETAPETKKIEASQGGTKKSSIEKPAAASKAPDTWTDEDRKAIDTYIKAKAAEKAGSK